ncbi:opsin-3 [Hydra vulgaris]|uniref:opsin-3 n=1 Tax=Hydra vulgaris TaxID=6087 RepID=UPI001F5EF5C8|nr:opsin-3-like [Hydra vulgaris]XP_047139602.1 opsin-3-like [Hydra vulgaris]XP_047139603.1 opsin-3-like [Hydra vulgaris]XP_047139604.1 opsin-3-like [Hydra vulgaris]
MNTNKVIQTVISTVLLTSVVLNMTACYIILVKVKRKEITHLFVVSISITNLLETTIGLTPQLAMADESLLESTPLCIVGGFAVLGFAITNITHLTMLSFIRTVAIKYPRRYFQYHKMFWCKVTLILVCYAYGFFWATLPIIGWSKYELDLDKKRCSLDWKLTKANSFSYILAIFICCNILPGIVIALTLYYSAKEIRHRKACKFPQNKKTDHLEKEYFQVCLLSAFAYFFFWTSYAIVGVLTLLKFNIPMHLATTTAMFSKLSTISNVLVNCYAIKSFQKQLLNLKIVQIMKSYLRVLIVCKKV